MATETEVVTLQEMKNILAKFYSNDANTIRYAHNRASSTDNDPSVANGMVRNVMRLFAGSVYSAGSFDLHFTKADGSNGKSVLTEFGDAMTNVVTIPIGKQWKDYMRDYLDTIIGRYHWNSPIYDELMKQYDQAANGFQMRRALYDIFSEVVRIREQGSRPTPPPTPTSRTVTVTGATWYGPSTITVGATLQGNVYPPSDKVITKIVVTGGASATYSGLSADSYLISIPVTVDANVVINVTVGDRPTPPTESFWTSNDFARENSGDIGSITLDSSGHPGLSPSSIYRFELQLVDMGQTGNTGSQIKNMAGTIDENSWTASSVTNQNNPEEDITSSINNQTLRYYPGSNTINIGINSTSGTTVYRFDGTYKITVYYSTT